MATDSADVTSSGRSFQVCCLKASQDAIAIVQKS